MPKVGVHLQACDVVRLPVPATVAIAADATLLAADVVSPHVVHCIVYIIAARVPFEEVVDVCTRATDSVLALVDVHGGRGRLELQGGEHGRGESQQLHGEGDAF